MYRFSDYKEQYAANIRLALPVMLTQVGQILTQFADNVMVGRYGGTDPLPLAAVSFGGSISFLFFITAIGVSMGLTPLVGELFAQGDRRNSSRLLQNGILFYTLLGVAAAALQLLGEPLLYCLGQPVEVVDSALPYYRLLACSLPSIMLFFAFKQFLEGVGNTRAELYVTVITNGLNILLNWFLIYGRGGLPAMGATGAGLATLLARLCAPVLMIAYFCSRPRYRLYLEGFRRARLHWRTVRSLLRMGLPIASQLFFESSAFIGTAIMMGWFGTLAISANQIATTLGNCAFMIVLSIGAATTIRISHCYGARDFGQLTRAARASYHLVLAWNTLAAILFIALRRWIPCLFTANAEVIALTSELMAFVALYQLSDGVQNVSVGILRGLQDVRIITPVALIAYWLLNIPIGALFAFRFGMGPSGLFLGYLFGLSATALLLIARIRRTVRRRRASLTTA